MRIVGVRPFGMFDTVILFESIDDDGNHHTVAVDHRPARDIRLALARGEEPEVEPESWQVLG